MQAWRPSSHLNQTFEGQKKITVEGTPFFRKRNQYSLLTIVGRLTWMRSTARSHIMLTWRLRCSANLAWLHNWKISSSSSISWNRRLWICLARKCAGARNKRWSACLRVRVPCGPRTTTGKFIPRKHWSGLRILPDCRVGDCVVSTFVTECLEQD